MGHKALSFVRVVLARSDAVLRRPGPYLRRVLSGRARGAWPGGDDRIRGISTRLEAHDLGRLLRVCFVVSVFGRTFFGKDVESYSRLVVARNLGHGGVVPAGALKAG